MAVRFQKFNRPTSQGIQEEKEMMQRLREEHLGMRNTDGTTPEVLFSGTMKPGGTNLTRNINGANFLSHQPGGKTGRYMERIDKIREKTQMYGTQKQNKNKKLNLQTKNLGNQEKMKNVYQGKGGNVDIEDLTPNKLINYPINLKNQSIQNMASVLQSIGTETRIIKDGKLYNNPLEARIDGYQAMCDQQKDAKEARVQFESMRRQMYGYSEPVSVKNSIAEKVVTNSMTVMSRDEAVQRVFEKYNKKPLLDDAAEALLKRNTKRRAGLSDAPKSFKDAVKAMPGYDLPLIRQRKGPLREDLVDVVSPGYTKQVAQLLSSRGGPSQNPVSDISMKNVSNSYSFGASFFTKFNPERMTTIAQSSLMNTKQFHETQKPKLQKEPPKLQKDVKRIIERASQSPPKSKFEPAFVPDPNLEYNSPMSMMLRSLQTEKEQMSKAMKDQVNALNITKYKSDSLSSKNSGGRYETLQDKAQHIKLNVQFQGNKQDENLNSIRNRSLKIVRKANNNMTVFKTNDKSPQQQSKNQKQRQPSIEYQQSRLSPQLGNRPNVENYDQESDSVLQPGKFDQSPRNPGKRGTMTGTQNSKEILGVSKTLLEVSKSNSLTHDSKPSSKRLNNKQQKNNILSIQPHQQKKTTWTVHNAERSEAAKRQKATKQQNRYNQTQVQPKQKDRESNNNIDIQPELVRKSIEKEAKRVFESQEMSRKVSVRKTSIKNEKSKNFRDSRGSSQMYKTQIGERNDKSQIGVKIDEDQVVIMSKEDRDRINQKVLPKRNAKDFATFDIADVHKTEMKRTFHAAGQKSPNDDDVPRIDFLQKRFSQQSSLKLRQGSIQKSNKMSIDEGIDADQMRNSKLNWIQKQATGNSIDSQVPFESSRLGQTSRIAKQKGEQIFNDQSKYNSPGMKTSPIAERKISIEQPYQLTPHQANGLQNYTVDMFDNSPVGISQMSVRESQRGPSKASAVMPRGSLMMFGANDKSSLLRSTKNEDLNESFPSKNTSKRIDEIQNNSDLQIQSKDVSFQQNNSIPKMSNNEGQNKSKETKDLNSQQQFYQKEKNETIQVISFDINEDQDITKTNLNIRSGSLQKFEQEGIQQFPLIEEVLQEQILSEENTHDSVKQKPFQEQPNFQQIVSQTPSQDIDYKPEYDYLYHQMDPKLNQTNQNSKNHPSPKLTRRANKQNSIEADLTNKKQIKKATTFESPVKKSSKWINADGSKATPARSPKFEERSKTIDLEVQKVDISLKLVEVEPISIILPSHDPGMKKERNMNNDSGSQVIDEQHIRQSISKAVKKITRLKGSRGISGLVSRLTRAKGQKREDIQLIQPSNEDEEKNSPLKTHSKFEEHQRKPSKWLGQGGKAKSFTLRELEKAMKVQLQSQHAKTMIIRDNSDLKDIDSNKQKQDQSPFQPFGEGYNQLNSQRRMTNRGSGQKEGRNNSQGSQEASQRTLKSKGSKEGKGSEPSLQHGVPQDHDWEKTPIYRQFVLHEPEEESLKDTEIMRRMIKEILDEKRIKKKLSKSLKGKLFRGKRQDSVFGSLDSNRDFDADKYAAEYLPEALERTRKKMLGEVEIDYLLEMLKKRDVNKEIVQENEKKLYFKKAKVTLEVHMAKMGLHSLYKTIIEQYEGMLKLEKSKPFDETLIKLLYRCLMNKRSIQKAQKIFKLIEKRDQLLHEFEDLVSPCGEEGHQDAELLSNSRRVGKQEKVLTQVCQQSSRLFIQVAQFLDESNHFKGQKFIYQQCDLHQVLREDILRLRLEYQPIFVNTIPIMDKYGRLQFNQDRTNDNGNTVSLKAKDDSNATNDYTGFQLATDKEIDPKFSSAGFKGWNTNRDRPTSPKSRAENEAIEEEEEHGESEYDSEYSYFD